MLLSVTPWLPSISSSDVDCAPTSREGKIRAVVRYHIFAHLRTFEDVTGVLYMTCCSSTALLFAIQIPFYRTYPISVYSVLQRGVVDDIRQSDKEDGHAPILVNMLCMPFLRWVIVRTASW